MKGYSLMERIMPKVALVGRANVGKSSLFNRLIEQDKSLVSATSGTTRDRFEAECLWLGRTFTLVDTGGLDTDESQEIERQIGVQANMAIEEAHVIVFVVDAQAGIQQEDLAIARRLQSLKKPVIFIANKADNQRIRDQLGLEKSWLTFPFKDPIAVSAKHGVGTGDLLDRVHEALEALGEEVGEPGELDSIRVAVIGKPNVGKSSLLNGLVGEERFIASSVEHTTRSSNDVTLTRPEGTFTLVDTAGIRKLANVRASDSKLEQAGVEQSLRSTKRAHVVLFVIDVTKNIRHQDKFLAGEIEATGASTIIIANKWDLVPDKTTNTVNEYERYIRAHLSALAHCPIVFTSAKTGQRVPGLFELIAQVYSRRFTKLSNSEAKAFISQAIVKHKPTRGKGVAHPRIKYFKQTGVNPPSFELAIHQTRVESLADSYLRFLKNLLRTHYDFTGTPIRIHVEARKKSHTT